jgi:hypothetical protein
VGPSLGQVLLALVLALPAVATSGCHSLSRGDYAQTRVLDDTRREVRRTGAARVVPSRTIYLDSVVVDVTATPTYRFGAVRQYEEVRDDAPLPPLLLAVAGGARTYCLHDYACGGAPKERTSESSTCPQARRCACT